MNTRKKIIAGIAFLLTGSCINCLADAPDIKFKEKYKLILPAESGQIEVGSLYRHEIKIDHAHKIQSLYRSKLSITLDCDKVSRYSSSNFIHDLLNSICHSLDRDSESQLTSYEFDSYLDGIGNYNIQVYKALKLDTFAHIISHNFDKLERHIDTYPPEKGKGWFFYEPLPDQYATVFMSRHHELRLMAIVNNQSVEPGFPCDKPVIKPSFPSHHLFCLSSSSGEQWCNDINAHETKYSCLNPGIAHFPPGFDDAIDSLEPLFMRYHDSLPLDRKLHLNHYATILPFYQFANGQSYPPSSFAYHKKISYESENCYSEESAEDDPGRHSSSTKIQYCRSRPGTTWESITLFENQQPILIFWELPDDDSQDS